MGLNTECFCADCRK